MGNWCSLLSLLNHISLLKRPELDQFLFCSYVKKEDDDDDDNGDK